MGQASMRLSKCDPSLLCWRVSLPVKRLRLENSTTTHGGDASAWRRSLDKFRGIDLATGNLAPCPTKATLPAARRLLVLLGKKVHVYAEPRQSEVAKWNGRGANLLFCICR